MFSENRKKILMYNVDQLCHKWYLYIDCTKPVADFEGVQGVHSNPPLDKNYFIFMWNFKRFCAKIGKRTPLLYI